jgi:alpha-tubulin suppressor-like RCC1 family protein
VHDPVSLDFGGADIVDVETGAQHACAVLASGEVRCWGDNQRGALGDGTETERLSPRPVLDVTNAVALSGGFLSTCARLSTGEARCWGLGSVGQRGDGTTTASALRPVAVRNFDNTANLADVAQIVSGDQFTCVRFTTGGGVACFGSNASGELGDGSGTNRNLPTPTGLTGAIDVTAGAQHACALLSTGELRCWGRNAEGQLGSGATSTRELSPVAVVGVP